MIGGIALKNTPQRNMELEVRNSDDLEHLYP